MRSRFSLSGFFMLLTSVILISAQPAHAYIDAGSGSAILNTLLAAIGAIAVALKIYWHRILKLLRIRKDKVPEKTTEEK